MRISSEELPTRDVNEKVTGGIVNKRTSKTWERWQSTNIRKSTKMQLNVVQFRYKIGYIVLNDSIPHNMEITDPAGNYIFKVNNRITRRRLKYVQS